MVGEKEQVLWGVSNFAFDDDDGLPRRPALVVGPVGNGVRVVELSRLPDCDPLIFWELAQFIRWHDEIVEVITEAVRTPSRESELSINQRRTRAAKLLHNLGKPL